MVDVLLLVKSLEKLIGLWFGLVWYFDRSNWRICVFSFGSLK